jgi:predicted nucleotidyltransferase
MTELEAALRRIAGELDARGVPWALVGGLAVGTRAEPRTTRDVDVAVAVEDDRAAESLVADLAAFGFAIQLVLEHDVLDRLATVRLSAPGSGLPVVVDLLFASSGIEHEVCAQAERLEIVTGLTVPVARNGHLIALKLLARDDRSRPQDYDDLRALISHAGEAEIQRARLAIERIRVVGASRGRDLEAALDELIRQFRP